MFALFGFFVVGLLFVYLIFSFIEKLKFISVVKENFFMDFFVYFLLVFYFTDGLNNFDLINYVPAVFFFWLAIKLSFFPIDLVAFVRNKLKD